jgi:hypothetical protein
VFSFGQQRTAIAAFFGGMLRLPCCWFLIPYALGTGGLLAAYVAVTGLDVAHLVQHNLIPGLIDGIVTGAILVINVLSQPLSDRALALIYYGQGSSTARWTAYC